MTDITRKRGDTYPIELTVLDNTGVAKDITGGVLLMTADPEKEPLDALNNIFQISGDIVSAADGTVTFAMTDLTSDYVGVFYYDVQLDRGGVKSTVVAAKLTMLQDITKD